VRLGTRGSPLALWQARAVAAALEQRAGLVCEIVVIRTSGDEGVGGSAVGSRQTAVETPHLARPTADPRLPTADSRLATPPAVKRLFVKELEEALLEGRIDAAVHSSKDMPAELTADLMIAATLPREDPRDALLLPVSKAVRGDFETVAEALGKRPRIGTSSVRRVAQLGAVFPHAVFADVRGNLDTRLRKLDTGEYDALVLAAAGLRRLGRADRISWVVPVDRSVPAPGQGIVAVEIRSDRTDVASMLSAISDRAAAEALAAERAVVHALGGGCQMPVGALAEIDDEELRVTGAVVAPDGSRVVRDVVLGPRREAAAVGIALAEALLRSGAGLILDAVRKGQRLVPEAAP
jgi:hydroxymethylbilane synthase